MELIEIGEDYLRGRMPVDQRTRQPAGALHGGVSVAFAETLASWSAAHVVDPANTTASARRSTPTTSAR
jgi:1,4-dihydroxy-2-naphthoyl-CoA hydrolase